MRPHIPPRAVFPIQISEQANVHFLFSDGDEQPPAVGRKLTRGLSNGRVVFALHLGAAFPYFLATEGFKYDHKTVVVSSHKSGSIRPSQQPAHGIVREVIALQQLAGFWIDSINAAIGIADKASEIVGQCDVGGVRRIHAFTLMKQAT